MFPDCRLSYHESALRQILSLADVLVLENVFWLSHAAELVAVVDPWVFPGENENATIGVKSFIQQAVDKAKHANGNLSLFTPESLLGYLLSPILTKPRPSLVRMATRPLAARSSTCWSLSPWVA